MAGEKPGSDPFVDAFLAALDAKIAALQQLRESYIAAASLGAIAPGITMDGGTPAILTASGVSTMNVQSPGGGPIDLPTGVFRGKGLAEAIRLFLSMAKRKQTTKDIKAALMEGGLATTAKFFDATLAGTLHRMKRNGELLQFKDGWDIAESYPENFRQRMQNSEEMPKRRKKKSKKVPSIARVEKAARALRNPRTPKFVEMTEPEQPPLRAVG